MQNGSFPSTEIAFLRPRFCCAVMTTTPVAPEAQLVAAHPTNRQDQVSGWMLLGVFRECFKRMKTSKKKEEE